MDALPDVESPMEGDDEIFPCKGCGDVLEEGKAFELAGNRWHLNCFRCNTCGTLLDSDANLLLLGDGSLICNNCTYSCSACGNKIEDLAILTGDQAFCATCFRCRNCKRKIENLRYARTSQGIFCMNCHESLMARRRKKSKAAAQARSKEKDAMLVDKSLPALPPNAISQSAFNSDHDTPGSTDTDAPTELSPRPRGTYSQNDSSSRSSSRRARSPDRSITEITNKDSLTLPSTIYRNNRHSVISQASDLNGGDGDSFFIPLALDPSPAPALTPRGGSVDARNDSARSAKDSKTERDYFGPKSSARGQSVDKGSKIAPRETDASSQSSTPHIAFQEKGRQPSSDYLEKPKDNTRKNMTTSRSTSSTASPAIGNDEPKVQHATSPSTSTGKESATSDRFRLQEVPKSKRTGMSRENSEADVSISSQENTIQRKEVSSSTNGSLLSADKSNVPRSSGESRRREDAEPRPSNDNFVSSASSTRNEPQGNKQIPRKEIASNAAKNIGTSPNIDTSPSSASSDAHSTTPTVNGKSISGPLPHSPSSEDIAPPSRALGRPLPAQQKVSDSYMAPRAPPPPPASSHRAGKGSVSSVSGEPVSPKLPRWSAGGDFTMDEDMARILGTDEGSQSILRRVSNAVRHGRNNSEASISGRHGHNRSISETTRTTASPRWPKTPIAEDSNGHAGRDISSPISIASPAADDSALLRRQLRNSEQRVAELERQFTSAGDLKNINKKLIEKRKTVTVLDSQAELMIRQIEVLAGLVERAKDSKQPLLNFQDMEDSALKEFMQKMERMKQSMSTQVEQLVEERDNLEEEKKQAAEDRDRALIEFEQLSSKNAQLADLNNDLTHQIQERFKSQSGMNIESPKPPINGLGIYTHHHKAKSSTSMNTEDTTLRPSTGTATLQSSTLTNVSTYPHPMDQDGSMEPATVLAAPHVVNIRKGRANKFNWKKGSATVAKGVTKGFKGAFSSAGQERGQWAGQPGDNIGLPYDSTVAPMESPGPNSLPRSASNDPRQGGFGIFKKSGTVQKTPASGSLAPIVAEPPTKLFGSFLVERADYERSQIPSIVTRCIEEVQLRGMDVEGIYRKSGGAGQVKVIQDGFERSTDYDDISDPDMDIIAVTSALKQYFRKLPIPLLTFDVYDRVLESQNIEDDDERCDHLRQTFNQLPPKHRDTLEYLIFHLYQVAEKREINKMHPKNIATVFAPTIMHSRNIDKEFQDASARNEVVEFIIEHCDEIFNNE